MMEIKLNYRWIAVVFLPNRIRWGIWIDIAFQRYFNSFFDRVTEAGRTWYRKRWCICQMKWTTATTNEMWMSRKSKREEKKMEKTKWNSITSPVKFVCAFRYFTEQRLHIKSNQFDQQRTSTIRMVWTSTRTHTSNASRNNWWAGEWKITVYYVDMASERVIVHTLPYVVILTPSLAAAVPSNMSNEERKVSVCACDE